MFHYISSFVFIFFFSILAMLILSPVVSSFTMHALHLDVSDHQLLYMLLFAGPPVITFLLTNLVYARRMGKRLYYFFDWIDQLVKGNYEVKPIEKSKTGMFSFLRLFQELDGQMSELTNTLKRSEQERKELEDMRRHWTAGVTHDLKTPLSYIQGYSAMLLSEKYEWSREERQAFLKIIHDKALHMKELINDLNIAYQFEDERIQIVKQNDDLIFLLKNIIADMKKEPRLAHGKIKLKAPEAGLYFHFDKKLLKRALFNLLSNAVLHNPKGTIVTVKVSSDADDVIIKIQDNGVGLAEKDVKQIFSRYYRGTTTDVTEGTGLGLSIAKQFIELHHGNIAVPSKLGKGTLFVITLPCK